MNEITDLEVIESSDLALERQPDVVLKEAKAAAQALQDVISNKARPVIFNDEQYLEFEDWQTIGRFYGITAKVTGTSAVEIGDVTGFEAEAVAIHVPTGKEISRAESMCMKDENNWNGKPLFQLRSMAQTRACAKALRNVLAWVVVLAGYKPTPAEEMESQHQQQTNGGNGGERNARPGRQATGPQIKMLKAKITAKAKASDFTFDQIQQHLLNHFGIDGSQGLLMGDVDEAIKVIEGIDQEGAPF